MGIHGIFKEIGPGQRISLAKLSSNYFTTHNRPFRLAVDISIWLFQIQAGKGGSNPALRTFYYRLLRLMSLNIHPLFVFDGPNKPTFKRNKKVGGPGVRVASVPEFLAKQLLKQFGFPWHVAPGEAEAECALLQREAVVDAVLSEDVDTLMFGCGTTLKNWTAENTTKTPTHVNVYRAAETKEKSGMDREGMVLVALMSGGDYITEGIPGIGPKVACDAARADFGKELLELAKRRDVAGLKSWRERLQHEINTNESKYFSRRNTKMMIPNDFPNREVLGYYTDPCISTPERLIKLRQELQWDQDIDFAALRSFTADAFDWRCIGGAKKFIRNLAPAMLVRDLRILGEKNEQLDTDAQAEREQEYVLAIHGKRNHSTTDNELEYRITYVPQNRVPIDLSIEREDDDFFPAGGAEDDIEVEDEWAQIPSSTQDDEDETPASPRKRAMKPYHPDQPEKLWLMKTFLQIGCPLLVEDYEASLRDPKKLFKQRRNARAAAKGGSNITTKKTTAKSKTNANDMPENALMAHMSVTKSSRAEGKEESSKGQESRALLGAVKMGTNPTTVKSKTEGLADRGIGEISSGFVTLPSAQHIRPQSMTTQRAGAVNETDEEDTPKASRLTGPVQSSSTARVLAALSKMHAKKVSDLEKTPRRRKRRSPELSSPPLSQRSQRTIDTWFSPSPRKQTSREIISLVSSSPAKPMFEPPQPMTPTPERQRGGFVRDDRDYTLPASVTKRRKPMKRAKTAPTYGEDEDNSNEDLGAQRLGAGGANAKRMVSASAIAAVDAIDLASTSPASGCYEQPVPIRMSTKPRIAERSSYCLDRPLTVSHPALLATASSITTKKLAIIPRDSLPGFWKEVDVESLDLSGEGAVYDSGWEQRGGRRAQLMCLQPKSWRKSGVEILDLTGD